MMVITVDTKEEKSCHTISSVYIMYTAKSISLHIISLNLSKYVFYASAVAVGLHCNAL